jgi:hypothetical protein
MKYAWSVGTLLVAAAGSVAADNCVAEAGNHYCNQVKAISYSNFGTAGQYQKVTTMSNGVCSFGDQGYAGGMAPLHEEVSTSHLSSKPFLTLVHRYRGISEGLCV